jgi:hypothetical protein
MLHPAHALPVPLLEEDPHWLVSAKGVFSSCIGSCENVAPCTGWSYVTQHIAQDSFLKTVKRLGVIYSNPVEFGVTFGAHSASLQEKFYQRQPLPEITFYGLEPGKKNGTVTRCTKFSNCFLRGIRYEGRKEYYSFYFCTISDKIILLDEKTRRPKGNAVFSWDLTKEEGK